MNVLETNNLFHSFSGDEAVLKCVDLKVERGSIYGFLGPNGAGKTTTLRLILGLLKVQEGSISIFGQDLDSRRTAILGRIGSLIESPSIYSHLTAEENLRVLQKIYQCPSRRIDEVLELVGLAHTRKKKAGQFSLGMKQRLAIAIAMLHEPELLILDEPTNGLDPNGMIEVRELLKRLNRESGLTIIISSHLLAEVERLVSHIGIIHKGRLMFQGSLDALKEMQKRSVSAVLESSDEAGTRAVLQLAGITGQYESGRWSLPAMDRGQMAAINRQLIAAGVDVYEISTVRNDLERIFMDMVEEA